MIGAAFSLLGACAISEAKVAELETDITGEIDLALTSDAAWQQAVAALFESEVQVTEERCNIDWSGSVAELGHVNAADASSVRSAQVSARLGVLDAVSADLWIADTIDEARYAELRSRLTDAPPLSGAEALFLVRGLGIPRYEDGVFTPGSLQGTVVLVDLATMTPTCAASVNVTNSPNAVGDARAADEAGFEQSPSSALLADLYSVATEAVSLHTVAGTP